MSRVHEVIELLHDMRKTHRMQPLGYGRMIEESFTKVFGLLETEMERSKEKLQAEISTLREALEHIDTWAQAYPLDIFPKPDLKKAAEVLKASGMTLDAISADNMRHVLDGIKGIVSEALKGEKNHASES